MVSRLYGVIYDVTIQLHSICTMDTSSNCKPTHLGFDVMGLVNNYSLHLMREA